MRKGPPPYVGTGRQRFIRPCRHASVTLLYSWRDQWNQMAITPASIRLLQQALRPGFMKATEAMMFNTSKSWWLCDIRRDVVMTEKNYWPKWCDSSEHTRPVQLTDRYSPDGRRRQIDRTRRRPSGHRRRARGLCGNPFADTNLQQLETTNRQWRKLWMCTASPTYTVLLSHAASWLCSANKITFIRLRNSSICRLRSESLCQLSLSSLRGR